MWGYPGKKLLFMGQEFAQGAEWSEARSLDWHQLDIARIAASRTWCATSTTSTATRPALHARDCEGEGFEWLIADDAANSVYAWLRKAPGANPVAVIANLTPVPRSGYRVPLPSAGRWREILNTDAGALRRQRRRATWAASRRARTTRASARRVTLPPLATVWLEFEPGS